MIDPAGLAQYEQVVSALMNQDNAVRSQAEDAFNQLKQQPDVFFSGLIQLARQNANEQIRSLSAVLPPNVLAQQAGWPDKGSSALEHTYVEPPQRAVRPHLLHLPKPVALARPDRVVPMSEGWNSLQLLDSTVDHPGHSVFIEPFQPASV